jgi:ParB family chromosome partitioning protein
MKNAKDRKSGKSSKSRVTNKPTNKSAKKPVAKSSTSGSGAGSPSYEVHLVPIHEIIVGGKRRPINHEKVEEQRESIVKIGLRTPLTVRPLKGGKKRLITGLHRLEAMKALGRTKVPCVYIKGDLTARLWEISENLHRSPLSVLEESEQIAEWVELTKELESSTPQGRKKGGPGRPEGLKKKAAKELPIPGKTLAAKQKALDRRLKIAKIDPAAKQAARDAGFADSQTKMSQIARESTPEAQLNKVITLRGGSGQKTPSKPADDADDVEPPLVLLKRAWKKAKAFQAAWQMASSDDHRAFIIEDLKYRLDEEPADDDDYDDDHQDED